MSRDNAAAASVTSLKSAFLAAVIASAISFVTLPPVPAVFSSLLAGLAIWIAVVDLEHLVIPDLANAAVAVLGLAMIAVEKPKNGLLEEISDALMRALVAGGLLLLVRLIFARFAGKDGLGLGDVKLMAAGAIVLSWASLPYALVLAAVAAIMAVVVRGIREGRWLGRETEIPFGAFLAPAIWAAFLLEQLYLL